MRRGSACGRWPERDAPPANGAKVVAGPVREGKRAVVKHGVSGADKAGPGDSVGEKGDERAVNGRAGERVVRPWALTRGPLLSAALACDAGRAAG